MPAITKENILLCQQTENPSFIKQKFTTDFSYSVCKWTFDTRFGKN